MGCTISPNLMPTTSSTGRAGEEVQLPPEPILISPTSAGGHGATRISSKQFRFIIAGRSKDALARLAQALKPHSDLLYSFLFFKGHLPALKVPDGGKNILGMLKAQENLSMEETEQRTEPQRAGLDSLPKARFEIKKVDEKVFI